MNSERPQDRDIWAVVPARSVVTGKSRLAPVVSDAARRYLNATLLRHTVETVKSAFDADRVLVVSACDEVRQLALQLGVETLRDHQPHGLNAALEQAAAEVARRGAKGVLVLPSDLPLLSASDLELLLCAYQQKRQMVISPNHENSGTNALLLAPVAAIPYAFGVGSFLKHVIHARELHLPTKVVRSQGLALDLDLPEDLAYWAELIHGAARYDFSRRVLSDLRARNVCV
ncbi:Phosphoenolpyruvate guanylyltransferase [Cupriavidus laharis]|uniref:3-phospho-D-glycerate guanylyltransferase n=1 Tax=Cupriavidus laharis TaxID=151654 RepID=A0ABN7YLY1_9BURK|nr:2-phospho-L-lactate guanylyltransferase [Cupriavidus laharis]CAG9173406.1 Phosphoenolpyruvate guanylyltransferase [Cupriavidus laharis]